MQNNAWLCPNCQELLVNTGGSFVCVGHHTFDIAKEGYVNFLVGQKLKYAGDTPEMLAARRRFLNAGFYEPLLKRMGEIVSEMCHDVVMEAGCGEGYYIGGLSEQFIGSKFLGTDIAKEGVKMGAKKYPNAAFGAADTNKFLPVANASVNVLLDIFAPRNPAEFARILNDEGRLVVVIPTSRHLMELRRLGSLLAVQEYKREVVAKALEEWFVLESCKAFLIPMQLNATEVLDLVAMTPNGWFLNNEQKEMWLAAGDVKVSAEFEILVFVHKR